MILSKEQFNELFGTENNTRRNGIVEMVRFARN